MALKESWKDAGVGFGHAFRDLGKAFANTAKTTIHKVDEWANSEDQEEEKKQDDVIEAEGEVVEKAEEK